MRKPLFLVLWTVLFALYFIFWDCPNAVRIVLKALPELLIIVAILCNRKAIGRRTLVPVAAALVLSVLGDTAGEFKFGEIIDIAFILQIAFFVVAQVCYTVSFVRNIEDKWWKMTRREAVLKIAGILLIFIYIFFVASKVFAALDSIVFIIACAVYMGTLLASGTTSILQKRKGLALFVLGAMFFIFSDSIIAINSFVEPVEHPRAIIMSTYFLAQLLLNVNLVKK